MVVLGHALDECPCSQNVEACPTVYVRLRVSVHPTLMAMPSSIHKTWMQHHRSSLHFGCRVLIISLQPCRPRHAVIHGQALRFYENEKVGSTSNNRAQTCSIWRRRVNLVSRYSCWCVILIPAPPTPAGEGVQCPRPCWLRGCRGCGRQ